MLCGREISAQKLMAIIQQVAVFCYELLNFFFQFIGFFFVLAGQVVTEAGFAERGTRGRRRR